MGAHKKAAIIQTDFHIYWIKASESLDSTESRDNIMIPHQVAAFAAR